MAHLFGCICNQPERLSEALAPVRHVLVAGAPVLRWGLGYIQSNEVLLSQTPRRSDQNVDFYEALTRIRSDYVIGHAAGDDGLHGSENTQPFRYRRWLFAGEGTVAGMDRLQPRLLERIPEFLCRNARGQTPAEYVFCLFLAALHARNAIEDTNLRLDEQRSVLAEAIDAMERGMHEERISGGIDNIIVSDGRSLVAVRLEQPFYMRRLVLPGVKRRGPSTFKGVLVVSAAVHPGEGFEVIPPRSVLLLSREVQAEVSPLHAQ